MSLKEQTKGALSAIAPFSSGSQTLDVQLDRRRLTCELLALDAIGCAFGRFVVVTDELSNASADRLKSISQALEKRLTYLLEPISPIELDADGCVVQMRSSPPQKGDDGTTYYELLVRRGGELSLCRYRKKAGGQRERIAAHLTREVFIRLVDDFSAVLS
jgi:hypothetical protein